MPVSDAVFARLLLISQAIAGQMDYQSVLQAFAVELQHLIPHDHMDIVLLAHDGEDHMCFEAGMHTSWSELATRPLPTALSPIRSVLWGKSPHLLADDALNDPRFHFEGALDGPIYSARLRSRIIVPLRVQGRIIGSLNISRQEPGRYRESDVGVAQQCGDLIAPYLYALMRTEEARRAAVAEAEARAREDTLRAGALSLTEGMERERQRLAMDLHDQTLADLARISRRIARLQGRSTVAADDLTELQDDVSVCLQELRRIVEDMKPGVLELFGFHEAVDALLARSTEGARPAVSAHIEDTSEGAPDRLPEPIRTALYRIVQEAVNNAVRHSAARHIRVHIAAEQDRIRVSITDDGCGARRPQARSGGINHMQTRAALIGAQVRIRRGPGGKGTDVSISVPLQRTATEPAGEGRHPAASAVK